jgi:preprotein translocase subunit SecA
MRKNVLKYDDVMNRQRQVIYGERRLVLEGKDIKDQIAEFVDDTLIAYIQAETAEGYAEDWDLEKLWTALASIYPISLTVDDVEKLAGTRAGLDADFLIAQITDDVAAAYASREETLGAQVMRELERKVLLSVLDRKWREHLYEMDYLQEGIGLRAMAQRDPLVEYQREGFDLFEVTVESNEQVNAKGLENKQAPVDALQYTAADENGVRKTGDVGRNSPCPCGSGKKYKRCHGAAQ